MTVAHLRHFRHPFEQSSTSELGFFWKGKNIHGGMLQIPCAYDKMQYHTHQFRYTVIPLLICERLLKHIALLLFNCCH